jgi:hypothetical protein
MIICDYNFVIITEQYVKLNNELNEYTSYSENGSKPMASNYGEFPSLKILIKLKCCDLNVSDKLPKTRTVFRIKTLQLSIDTR